jgi:hypothetical protein
MLKGLIYQDSRFWEVFDETGVSLGLFMYGDLMNQFTNGHGVLDTALTFLKSKNYTWKVVGNIHPLDEDSANPIIQAKKIESRNREKKKEKKQAKKKGFKLESHITFGKLKGTKIKDIIDKHQSYWGWLTSNNVLLLHPEIISYQQSKNL